MVRKAPRSRLTDAQSPQRAGLYLHRGELSVETEDGETATIGPYDSVRFESDEPHIVANQTEEQAIGIDVFAPGRSFDFWLNRL